MSSSSNTSAIGQQILQDAGFYPPSVYDLLSRFSALFTTNDPDSDGYVPYTDVQPGSSTQVIPFVVGFLPPSAPVASPISRAGNTAIQNLNANNSSPGTAGAGTQTGLPSGNNAGGATAFSAEGAAFIANHEGFNPKGKGAYTYGGSGPSNNYLGDAIGYGHDIQPGQFVGNDSNGNPMFNIYGTTYTVPITRDQAQTILQQDAGKAAQAVSNNITAPLTQNQFDMLTSIAYSTGPGGFVTKTGGLIAAVNSGNDQAVADIIPTLNHSQGAVDPGLTTIRNAEKINYFRPDGTTLKFSYKSNVPHPTPGNNPNPQPVGGDVPQPNSWYAGGGGGMAQTAAQQLTVQSTTVLNTTNTGTQTLASQQTAMINAITQQVNQMVNTPPLRLLVNPRSFKNSLEKITSDGSWGRNGPIIEHWGEQMDKIEASGKIAAFYALDSNPPGQLTDNDPGLTRMVRNSSTAYQNLLSLYLIYRNNGGIWTEDFINPASTKTNLSIVGSIFIFYDNILYVGSFDNFTISESDEAPYSLEYSFSFTVRAWFELDQQQDPLLAWGPVGTAPTESLATGNATLDKIGGALGTAYDATVGYGVNNSQAALNAIANVSTNVLKKI